MGQLIVNLWEDDREVLLIVQNLVNESIRSCDIGFMFTAIYDTAWVATVSRTTALGTYWLFPDCFQHLLDHQSVEGGWTSYTSQVDGILSTLAVLLALVKYNSVKNQHSDSTLSSNIGIRIVKAATSLQTQLQDWDVNVCDQVGFEILVSALLTMLDSHGFISSFPGRQSLMNLNEKRLAKFSPEMLYGPLQVTHLHSLEAFVGTIDFDRVSHHKTVHDSMMTSPSSTAVHLMNRSVWDHDAEVYLRTVITEGVGKSNDSVPCAFPITVFELTWVRNIYPKSFLISLLMRASGALYASQIRLFHS